MEVLTSCTGTLSGRAVIHLAVFLLKLSSTVQVVMIVVMSTNRLSGVRSAGLPFVFWLVMSIYGAMKLRTLVLLAEDSV